MFDVSRVSREWGSRAVGRKPSEREVREVVTVGYGRSGVAACALLLGCEVSEPSGTSYDASSPTGSTPTTTEPTARSWFAELAPIDYELGRARVPKQTTRTRLSLRFFPADREDRPLCALFNGGPGVSSLLLQLGFGATEDGDRLLSHVCHTLFIDERNAGFSYNLAPNASGEPPFTTADYNPYVDAADHLRALLDFYSRHPEYALRPVVLVGESYGGMRVNTMLHMVRHRQRYATGEQPFLDVDLLTRLEALEQRLDVPLVEHFSYQVLIQPFVTGSLQDDASGELFRSQDSILTRITAETGVVFTSCNDDRLCYYDALDTLEEEGLSPYDYRRPVGLLEQQFAATRSAIATRQGLTSVLGIAPEEVPLLLPAARLSAFRSQEAGTLPSEAEPVWSELGPLRALDRYYLPFHREVFNLFYAVELQEQDLDWLDAHYGELFLENLRSVHTFITRAEYDLVAYSPGLFHSLQSYDGVSTVQLEPTEGSEPRPGRAHVVFTDGTQVTIRSPGYPSGHSVPNDQGAELAEDVRRWLESIAANPAE